MKTKLLKKIRKRFSIYYLPKGIIIDGNNFDYKLYKLVDKNGLTLGFFGTYCELTENPKDRFCENYFSTEKECIDYLKGIILNTIKKEYGSYGYSAKEKNVKKVIKKVWP